MLPSPPPTSPHIATCELADPSISKSTATATSSSVSSINSNTSDRSPRDTTSLQETSSQLSPSPQQDCGSGIMSPGPRSRSPAPIVEDVHSLRFALHNVIRYDQS